MYSINRFQTNGYLKKTKSKTRIYRTTENVYLNGKTFTNKIKQKPKALGTRNLKACFGPVVVSPAEKQQ